MAAPDRATCKARWTALFKQALDADTWGQALEASDFYTELAQLMERQYSSLGLDTDDDSVVTKVITCLKLRNTALTDLSGNISASSSIKLDNMKSVYEVLGNLFVKKLVGRFPVDLSKFQDQILRQAPKNDKQSASSSASNSDGEFGSSFQGAAVSSTVISSGNASSASSSSSSSKAAAANNNNNSDEKDDVSGVGAGTLLSPPTILTPNLTCIVVDIEKIGLKDAENYIDARMTVTVVDSKGKPVEPAQDTPITNRKKPQHVMFGNTVYIQTPLEKLDPGFAIFFEFKHYKPDKKKISTRCFTFMEKDEVVQSPGTQLELYCKPTDFNRKDLRLFTIKQLYLNVKITYRKS